MKTDLEQKIEIDLYFSCCILHSLVQCDTLYWKCLQCPISIRMFDTVQVFDLCPNNVHSFSSLMLLGYNILCCCVVVCHFCMLWDWCRTACLDKALSSFIIPLEPCWTLTHVRMRQVVIVPMQARPLRPQCSLILVYFGYNLVYQFLLSISDLLLDLDDCIFIA